MSITIRDCLNLPSFSFANVVAGAEGLDKIVSSVSVMEFFDYMDLDVFTPNELVISAFYDLRDDIDKQCDALKDLMDTGTIALVFFYVGKVLPHIDDKLKAMADQMNFPLIQLDSNDIQVKYSDIISDVMNAIISDQNAAQDFVTATQLRLEQLPQELRSMENLLGIMSGHYKCSLLLTGASQLYFRSLYRPSLVFGDPNFFYRQFHDEPAGYLAKDVDIDGNTLHLYKMDFSHSESTRMTLYASCYNTTLNEKILRDMCTCTRFFSTVWGYQLDFSSPDTLLSLILKAEAGAASRALAGLNLDFEKISNLIVVSAGNQDILQLRDKLTEFFKEYHKFFLSGIIDDQIVILSAVNLTDSRDYALYDELFRFVEGVDESASFFMDGGSKDIAALKRTYQDYRRSLPALRKIFGSRRNWDNHDIMLCQEVIALSETENKRTEYLTRITAALKEDRDDLLTTLAVYLIDCDGKLNMTAEALFLHRNTVTYRLNKIRQLTNTNFTLMPASYDFYIAAALWRYQKSLKPAL